MAVFVIDNLTEIIAQARGLAELTGMDGSTKFDAFLAENVMRYLRTKLAETVLPAVLEVAEAEYWHQVERGELDDTDYVFVANELVTYLVG